MDITQTILTRRRLLEAFANAWLAAGATGYAIADVDGTELMSWPASAAADDLCVPIMRRRTLLGQLRLGGLSDGLSADRLAAEAQTIAQFVMLDRDLEQMTQEVVERQDELVAMLELTQSTRNQLDLGQLSCSVLRQTLRLFGCEATFVAIDLAGSFAAPFYQFPLPIAPEDALLGWLDAVRASGRELVINANSAENPLPTNINNLLVAPLTVRGNIAAAIGLVNKRNAGFSYPNRKLLTAVAQQVAAQFENALLHAESIQQAKRNHEIALARDVQMHLLPKVVPSFPHVEVAAHWRPANELCGDFFDYLPSDKDELRFTLGDVSGKGMPAALLMGMSHTTLRSAATFLDNPTPAAILDHANTALYDDFTKVSMFATVFVGQYDSTRRTITYANAGHSPVIYCPADGAAVMLEADGTALGILTWCLSEDHSLVLGAGDLLIVASDGFSEAENGAGEMFGYDRLLQTIEDNRGLSAEQLLTTLTTAVLRFSGQTEQGDDKTMLILKGLA